MTAAESKKKKFTQENERTEKGIERAGDLLDLLKNENKRWSDQGLKFQEKYKNFLGDMIISSGIIAYLGVFPESYRTACIKSWCELLTNFGITKSENFSLYDTLYDPIEIFLWKKEKLPTNETSIQNAIIMEKSERFPLFIDPQMQAVTWIDGKKVVEAFKGTQKSEQILKKLLSSMPGGNSVILTDMSDNIDPILLPIIKKEITIEGGQSVIRIGDDVTAYNKKFMLYMATRMTYPHFPPAICANVNLINFTATEETLTDQMLNIIVNKEELNSQRTQDEAIQASVDIRRKLTNMENTVIQTVTTRKEEILKSDQSLETLRNTKSECHKFTLKMEEQRKNNEKLEQARQKYQTVAKRVSNLYFCVCELSKLETMYQYSFESYKELYLTALYKSFNVEADQKLNMYRSEFTHLLFDNICKSLLEKDKFPFTVSLLFSIFVAEEMNTPAEVKFLLSGSSPTPIKAPENPISNWLSDKGWQKIYDASQTFPAFKDFEAELTNNSAEWEKIVNSKHFINTTKYPWPNEWSSQGKLNYFQQLIVINAIKPERTTEGIHMIINEYLGKEYFEYPSLDLDEVFNKSNPHLPLLFLTSRSSSLLPSFLQSFSPPLLSP